MKLFSLTAAAAGLLALSACDSESGSGSKDGHTDHTH